MSVDIRTTWFSRYEEANCSGLIIDYFELVKGQDNCGVNEHTKWHHNPGVTELLIDGIDILDIRPLDPGHAKSVLILGLKSYHRSAIGDLCFCNNLANVLNVVLGCIQIAGLIGAQDVGGT
jgi:hypothetical protein